MSVSFELEMRGLSSDGRAVGRTDEGLAVFVRGALPGQRVLVQMTRRKKSFAEAEVLSVIRHAEGERPAPCRHATECGGCPWQCLPYPMQLRWKKRIVADALNRIGHLGLSEDAVPEPLFASDGNAPAEWHCRNKMEFCFSQEDGQTVLGMRARSSHRAFNARHCLLQTPRTMAVLNELRELCAAHGLSAAPESTSSSRDTRAVLRYAVIREPRAGGCVLEMITLPAPSLAGIFRNIGEALLSSSCGVTGFIHSMRAARAAVAYGEKTVLALGQSEFRETLHINGRETSFHLGHASFFQVNTPAAELLYNTAVSMAGELFAPSPQWGDSCWDIYCGVGGLALSIAPHFSRVYGVEISSQAARLAAANAEANGMRHGTFLFESGNASSIKHAFKKYGAPDLLVTDPPRAGMDPDVTAAILKYLPPRLLLISCDPATLARDLALLVPAYALHAIQPVDIFPQTPHVETVVSMSRVDR